MTQKAHPLYLYLTPVIAAAFLLIGGYSYLEYALLLLLVAATIHDQACQRIPNIISLSGWLLGLGAHTLLAGGHGAGFALAGLATGFAFLMPFYLLRVMGAGDVKLAAAIGAFLGTKLTITALLATFVWGGLLALWVATRRQQFQTLSINLHILFSGGVRGISRQAQGLPSVGKFPYALAMLLGVMTALWILPAFSISLF